MSTYPTATLPGLPGRPIGYVAGAGQDETLDTISLQVDPASQMAAVGAKIEQDKRDALKKGPRQDQRHAPENRMARAGITRSVKPGMPGSAGYQRLREIQNNVVNRIRATTVSEAASSGLNLSVPSSQTAPNPNRNVARQRRNAGPSALRVLGALAMEVAIEATAGPVLGAAIAAGTVASDNNPKNLQPTQDWISPRNRATSNAAQLRQIHRDVEAQAQAKPFVASATPSSFAAPARPHARPRQWAMMGPSAAPSPMPA